MNFEKLASNLNEEEKKLESEILPYCNPQQIAHELMSNLEKTSPVGENYEIGPGNFVESGALFTSYRLWWIKKPVSIYDKGSTDGPLANCSNKDRLAQVVLNSVKKYITDDIIKLGLNGWGNDYTSTKELTATISRADVEKIKRMNRS